MKSQPTLRAELEAIIGHFGLAAALHGISEKNPKPKDPTDAILELISSRLDRLQLDPNYDVYFHIGFGKAITQVKALLEGKE